MDLNIRECRSRKCDAEVADVLIVADKGSHKELAIDPKPVSWGDGGRIRISPVQPGVAKFPLARRLSNARAAFGAGNLYRPHKDTCAGGTGRATTRRKGEHA